MILRDAKEKAEETYQHLIDYAEARWNVVALQISDTTANVVTSIVVGIIIGVLGLFFLVFASISLALWLGSLVDSNALGFLFVALIYALTGLVIFLNRMKWLFLPFMNVFLKILYKDKDDKLI